MKEKFDKVVEETLEELDDVVESQIDDIGEKIDWFYENLGFVQRG